MDSAHFSPGTDSRRARCETLKNPSCSRAFTRNSSLFPNTWATLEKSLWDVSLPQARLDQDQADWVSRWKRRTQHRIYARALFPSSNKVLDRSGRFLWWERACLSLTCREIPKQFVPASGSCRVREQTLPPPFAISAFVDTNRGSPQLRRGSRAAPVVVGPVKGAGQQGKQTERQADNMHE